MGESRIWLFSSRAVTILVMRHCLSLTAGEAAPDVSHCDIAPCSSRCCAGATLFAAGCWRAGSDSVTWGDRKCRCFDSHPVGLLAPERIVLPFHCCTSLRPRKATDVLPCRVLNTTGNLNRQNRRAVVPQAAIFQQLLFWLSSFFWMWRSLLSLSTITNKER